MRYLDGFTIVGQILFLECYTNLPYGLLAAGTVLICKLYPASTSIYTTASTSLTDHALGVCFLIVRFCALAQSLVAYDKRVEVVVAPMLCRVTRESNLPLRRGPLQVEL